MPELNELIMAAAAGEGMQNTAGKGGIKVQSMGTCRWSNCPEPMSSVLPETQTGEEGAIANRASHWAWRTLC